MKKYFIIISLILLSGLITPSCLKDEGNYEYEQLGDFYIDTLGKQTTFTVKQYSDLSVSSNLVYYGNKSDLTYKWPLYQSENQTLGKSKYPLEESHGFTKEDFPSFVIAETENLSESIIAEPGSYYLQFEATETKTGLTAMMRYPVTIESVVGTGLLVFYKGGNNADCDLVSTPLLNANVIETVYSRNLYSRANPSNPLSGNPRSCLYVTSGEYVYLATDQDAKRLSRIDMSVVDDFEGIFQSPPQIKDFYIPLSDMIINDSKFYKITSWGLANFIGPHLMLNGDTYVAANFAIKPYGANAVIYDQSKMRFLYSGMWNGYVETISAPGTHFSFNNVGKKLIYGNAGFNAGQTYITYCIFKNPTDDGKRFLYSFRTDKSSHSAYTTVAALDLSACPQVAAADFWAFGERGPVTFYATKEKIYQLDYIIATGVVNGAAEVRAFPASEEITCMKLFKNAGINLSVSAKDKYLLVATYKSSTNTGTLYVLETDIANGTITSTPSAVYTFSGKIGDVDFISR